MSNNSKSLKKLTGIAIFSALAYVVALVCRVIPQVAGFLSFDAKDAIIVMASFIYGVASGPIISLIAALLELTFSNTGFYGFIMNFVSSASFSLVASLIYKYKKTFTGALISFLCATLTTTLVMMIMNIFVTPIYLEKLHGVQNAEAVVISMLPNVLLPFNFAKALMNSAIAMLLYKPIILALRRAHILEPNGHKTEFNKTTVMTIVIGGLALILGILIVVMI